MECGIKFHASSKLSGPNLYQLGSVRGTWSVQIYLNIKYGFDNRKKEEEQMGCQANVVLLMANHKQPG